MKKQSFKIRSLVAGLFATISIGLSIPANANHRIRAEVKAQPIIPAVEFLGSENNSSLFAVNLEHEAPVSFELNIRDESGTLIFSQEYVAAKFSKIFKLVNEDRFSSPAGLSFQIKVKPNGAEHNFEVSTETDLIKEVVVTKY